MSYQSPPTSTPGMPASYRAPTRRPSICGSSSGSKAVCRLCAISRCSAYRRLFSAARPCARRPPQMSRKVRKPAPIVSSTPTSAMTHGISFGSVPPSGCRALTTTASVSLPNGTSATAWSPGSGSGRTVLSSRRDGTGRLPRRRRCSGSNMPSSGAGGCSDSWEGSARPRQGTGRPLSRRRRRRVAAAPRAAIPGR